MVCNVGFAEIKIFRCYFKYDKSYTSFYFDFKNKNIEKKASEEHKEKYTVPIIFDESGAYSYYIARERMYDVPDRYFFWSLSTNLDNFLEIITSNGESKTFKHAFRRITREFNKIGSGKKISSHEDTVFTSESGSFEEEKKKI